MEYIVLIIFFVVVIVVGNFCYICIKGEWKICLFIYMMLVGCFGFGKIFFFGFIYKLINEYDDWLYEKYELECDEYERVMFVGKYGNDGEG